MDIRPLTESYSVSPQIAPDDAALLAAQGYGTVICNRPDSENPPELEAEAIGAAVRAAGMEFVVNPVIGGAITEEMIAAQGAAIAAAKGPILAYCASGNRSSIVWALSQAGTRPVEELIALPARHGYNLEAQRARIEARSAG